MVLGEYELQRTLDDDLVGRRNKWWANQTNLPLTIQHCHIKKNLSYDRVCKVRTKILFSITFTRTLIIEFPDISSWAQSPVINVSWYFVTALEKRRKVVVVHSKSLTKGKFLRIHRLRELHRLYTNSVWNLACVHVALLWQLRKTGAGIFDTARHQQELYPNFRLQIIRDFAAFKAEDSNINILEHYPFCS